MTGYGVSPAYHLSRYGESFGPREVASSLPLIRRLDPTRAYPLAWYEPEFFRFDVLDAWTPRACTAVRSTSEGEGLAPSQFVAHFLGAEANPSGDVLARVCRIAQALGTSRVVLPLLPVAGGARGGTPDDTSRDTHGLYDRLASLAAVAAEHGCALAVELVPDGPVPTVAALRRLGGSRGESPVGLNLDTGNALAAGEDPAAALTEGGVRVTGTHLCDYGEGGSSMVPGCGSGNWPGILAALDAAGYEGSLDLEIRCGAESVDTEYARGLKYLQSIRAADHGSLSEETARASKTGS